MIVFTYLLMLNGKNVTMTRIVAAFQFCIDFLFNVFHSNSNKLYIPTSVNYYELNPKHFSVI